MSDGWETRRSQENRGKYAPGQKLHGRERYEWAVARLAGTGNIEYVEVDTAFHPGNYPCVSVSRRLYSSTKPR
jgi:allantoicase